MEQISKIRGNRLLKWDDVVARMKAVHKDENLEYPLQEYDGIHSKIRIIDHDLKDDGTEYGEYWQEINAHLRGHSYPGKKMYKFNQKKILKQNEIIKQRFREVHGDVYDYSKTVYNGYKVNCIITCKTHGDFEMTPDNHLHGHGCPYCGNVHKYTTEEWVEKAKSVHGDRYTYDKTVYVSAKTPVIITCPRHGDFEMMPGKHLAGQRCPKCFGRNSIAEGEIYDYLMAMTNGAYEIKRNVKNVIPNRELDLYIPQIKIGIEYNGLYWHSEACGKDRKYHINKLEECNRLGIKLVQIFEDEWLEKRDIVLNKLLHIIGCNQKAARLGARNCFVSEIDRDTAERFLNANHIQGFANSTLYYGAFVTKTGELVGVMTFRENKPNMWELTRFTTDINYTVVGLGGKMFSYFKSNNDYDEVKTFADRRWTVDIYDSMYTKIGFEIDKIEAPDYNYVVDNKRKHKFLFRKQILSKKYGLPLTMTEKEMCDYLGFYRIWNCGIVKYIFKNPDKRS